MAQQPIRHGFSYFTGWKTQITVFMFLKIRFFLITLHYSFIVLYCYMIYFI